MKKATKKRAKKRAASIAHGHVRALAKRGIKIDKLGRARKDGKPLAKEKLKRAVSSIERAARSYKAKKKISKKEKPPKPVRTAKPKKQSVAPKAQTKKKISKKKISKELSERDAFIIESLRRNHLLPAERRRYLKNLSPHARESFESENVQIEKGIWDQVDNQLREAIKQNMLDRQWWRIADEWRLPHQEIFERGQILAGLAPADASKMWERHQSAEQLIEEAKKKNNFFSEYTRIALLTGLTAREVYTLGISPPSLGVVAPSIASGTK